MNGIIVHKSLKGAWHAYLTDTNLVVSWACGKRHVVQPIDIHYDICLAKGDVIIKLITDCWILLNKHSLVMQDNLPWSARESNLGVCRMLVVYWQCLGPTRWLSCPYSRSQCMSPCYSILLPRWIYYVVRVLLSSRLRQESETNKINDMITSR